MHTHNNSSARGFALLVAIIFTAVILSVGLSLLDVSYKQIILASTSKKSQYAFYNADAALECALEMDQVSHTFDYVNEPTGTQPSPIMCEGQSFKYSSVASDGTKRTTTFNIPCQSSSTTYNASVTVYKYLSATPTTRIYVNGFNNCNASDPYQVVRGLKSSF